MSGYREPAGGIGLKESSTYNISADGHWYLFLFGYKTQVVDILTRTSSNVSREKPQIEEPTNC